MLMVWRFEFEEKDCSGTVKRGNSRESLSLLGNSYNVGLEETKSELNMFKPGKLGSIACEFGKTDL